MNKNILNLTQNIIKDNPVFVLLLGFSPMLAITTNVISALGLGLATGVVLVLSLSFFAFLQKFIPDNMQFLIFIIITTGLVSIADMLMKVWFPTLSENLGIFVPLMVVNSILLYSFDFSGGESSWLGKILKTIGIALGFILALFILAALREIIGAGTFANIILFNGFVPLPIIILPPGAFLSFGLVISFFSFLPNKYLGVLK